MHIIVKVKYVIVNIGFTHMVSLVTHLDIWTLWHTLIHIRCHKQWDKLISKVATVGLINFKYIFLLSYISLECSLAKESEYRFKKYLNPFWLYLVSVHWSYRNINGSHKTHTWAWYKFGRWNKETTRSWLILPKATTLQTSYDCLV